MAQVAEKLKQEGNQLFKAGDYAAAEERYTAAITKYPHNPLIFTNRALSRIRLQKWQFVINDCLKSIELTQHQSQPGYNFKSYFYLAQAQLALHHPNEALCSALVAYNQAMNPPPAEVTRATSALPSLSDLVLQCKKAKFAAKERERRRRRGDILAELEETLEAKKRNDLLLTEEALSQNSLGVIEAQDRRAEILETHQTKLDELRSVFALADPENHQPREIPDYLVDTISFEIMHDPVITRTGHSYERATLLEYLKNSPMDPLTREPLSVRDLRPNVALRQVLEEFWKTAGTWAIDW